MKKLEDNADHENRLKIILANIRTDDDKASAEEQRKKIALFEAASKMQRQVISAESKADGIYKPEAVCGRIILSFLGKSKSGHKATNHTRRTIGQDEMISKD